MAAVYSYKITTSDNVTMARLGAFCCNNSHYVQTTVTAPQSTRMNTLAGPAYYVTTSEGFVVINIGDEQVNTAFILAFGEHATKIGETQYYDNQAIYQLERI